MNPADFGNADTLTCTLAAMLYKALQRSQDPSLEKALNPLGLMVPWHMRSAKVRNVWEKAVRKALEDMSIIGDTAHDLHIHNKPAALELEESDSIF